MFCSDFWMNFFRIGTFLELVMCKILFSISNVLVVNFGLNLQVIGIDLLSGSKGKNVFFMF